MNAFPDTDGRQLKDEKIEASVMDEGQNGPQAIDEPVVIVGVLDQIEDTHIQAMSSVLARVLVEHALAVHGIRPSNDNE